MDQTVDQRLVTVSEFYLALVEGVNRGNFNIGLTLERATARAFELFCEMVWSILDGDHQTVACIEEVADVTGHAKAADSFGTLIREGRKYGLVLIATSQRGQEIPKTIYSQCQHRYIGCHDLADAEYIGKRTNVDPQAIYSLDVGEFYYKQLGPGDAKKIKFKKL